jgi:hypothetical protein
MVRGGNIALMIGALAQAAPCRRILSITTPVLLLMSALIAAQAPKGKGAKGRKSCAGNFNTYKEYSS